MLNKFAPITLPEDCKFNNVDDLIEWPVFRSLLDQYNLKKRQINPAHEPVTADTFKTNITVFLDFKEMLNETTIVASFKAIMSTEESLRAIFAELENELRHEVCGPKMALIDEIRAATDSALVDYWAEIQEEGILAEKDVDLGSLRDLLFQNPEIHIILLETVQNYREFVEALDEEDSG